MGKIVRSLRKTFPLHGEQALAIFHNRYRPSLVRSFKIRDTLPEDYRHVRGDRDFFYRSYPNCYFVRFVLTSDDRSIVDGRLLVISKSIAQILFDELRETMKDDDTARASSMSRERQEQTKSRHALGTT